jgi:hypothetical protein
LYGTSESDLSGCTTHLLSCNHAMNRGEGRRRGGGAEGGSTSHIQILSAGIDRHIIQSQVEAGLETVELQQPVPVFGGGGVIERTTRRHTTERADQRRTCSGGKRAK